ncbi:MAG: hypothetical protein CXR30_17620 [Geobacter sp.]|nr:MAG: hypothetical protein CXR30_17620 [Geobacter sp.]
MTSNFKINFHHFRDALGLNNTISIVVAAMLLITTNCFAATDGAYTLSEVTGVWDGTSADATAPVTAEYNYVYGDDTTMTYTLPWIFFFYGHGYNQIVIDTNGAIWFDSDTSAHDFNLATPNRGLVLAPWNYDLSSTYEGGVFVQHKSNPERVVIEWRTETYSDEGDGLLNIFEAVIFLGGVVRFDYQSFTAVNPGDSGSGISKDDGSYYLSSTTNYGNSYSLAGHSFSFTPSGPSTTAPLSVDINGTGTGSVTTTPVGLACNASCSLDFPLGTPVTLHPSASQYSSFTGWNGGGCSGLDDCVLTLTANTLVSATFTFNAANSVKIDGVTGYYPTLQGAYDVAPDGAVMKLWATDYSESLNCARPITVTLQGGYDENYTTQSGMTVLKGALTISNGIVIVNGLSVR